MSRHKLITVLLLCFLAFLLAFLVYSSFVRSKGVKSLNDLSRDELDSILRCAPELYSQIDPSQICTMPNERKHPIFLLSSTPKLPISNIRSLYEIETNLSSYSHYDEDNTTHSLACTYQTGPWQLYCRGKDGHCNYHHPPPWEIPYFVKTDYPAYNMICEDLGYSLPTHDALIHIVRNPLSSIAYWNQIDASFSINDYSLSFSVWHQFWRDYELQYPNTPSLWIRHEDICLCMKDGFRRLFRFLRVDHLITNMKKFQETLEKHPCETPLTTDLSVFGDSLPQILVQNDWIAKHFGYSELTEKMVELHKKEEMNEKDLRKALWPDLDEQNIDNYCQNLVFARLWYWFDRLG